MDIVRTAILGYGRSGSTLHAGPIERLPDFGMAAVCDIDPVRRAEAAGRFGCPVYEDYREMLRKERLDLVCIVTRNDQHCAMACDCLAAGVDVLVTKPWAADRTEAERMIAAAAESGRSLLPWLPARWGPDLRRLLAMKHAKAIGDIFTVRRTVASFAVRNDWQTRRDCAGGYLLNWGPHIVDPAVLLAGGRVRSVFGRMKQTINPGDVEDLFDAVITMENGTLVHAEYTVSPVAPPDWFVQGDRGAITIRGAALTAVSNTPAKPADPTNFSAMAAQENTVVEETLPGNPYGDQFEIYGEIADAVRGEKPFAVQPEDALELTRILDAVRASNAEDRVVRL